jgi:pyrroline-5-carboxylate reductase
MSIMAGINLNKICNSLNLQNAVRIMPNTPSQVGKGISIWVSKNSLKPREEVMVAHILDSLGVSIKTLEEEDIDKATAVSGSGPGFLFLIMETMYKTAKEIGLNDEMAKVLISQTFLGSGELAVYSKKSFAELKNEVISPSGTTEAGINAMMNNGIEKALSEGIKKAFRRSQELNDS